MARSTTRKIHRDGTFHGSAAETGMRYPAGMRYPWKTPIHRDFGPTYVTPPPGNLRPGLQRAPKLTRLYSPKLTVVLANLEVADKLGGASLPSIPLLASVGGAGGGFLGFLSPANGASV